MKNLRIIFILFWLIPKSIQANVDWEVLSEEIYHHPELYQLTAIGEGASNLNYCLEFNGERYFIRFASQAGKMLGADIEVEYKILQALDKLEISPRPIYYNRDKKILVTEFLASDEEPVDLSDPSTRQEIVCLLHQMEKVQIDIGRTFQPYRDILHLIELDRSLGGSGAFGDEMLETLNTIDDHLSKVSTIKKLCHLDLFHFNIIKSKGRFWIIDWEYAKMSDPLLTLGAMSAIEFWDDQQMEDLLKDYLKHPLQEDFNRLFLYRIVMDLHWAAWCHLQGILSSIDRPYEVWKSSYLNAAQNRIHSLRFSRIIRPTLSNTAL